MLLERLVTRSLVVLTLLMGLTGCVRYTGIDLLGVKREVPEDIADTRFVDWPDTAWWESYRDPALDDLVENALRENPDLDFAEARVRIAESIAGYVGALRKPRVDAGYAGTWQRYSENGLIPPALAGDQEVDSRFAVDLTWELDLFGKLREARTAAEQQVEADRMMMKVAHLAIASAVARTYFRLAEACAQREVGLATIAQRERILALVDARVAMGLDSQVERLQAQAAIPKAEEEIARLDEQISLLRSALSRLAVVPLASTANLAPSLKTLPVPALPDPIPSDLVARRADLVAARWQVESLIHGIQSVKGEFYPTVNLSSFAGFSSLGLDDLMQTGSGIYGIAPSVRLPLFDAGRLRAKLSFVTAQGDAAIAHYNDTLLEAMQEVIHAITSIRALQRQTEVQHRARRAAEQAYDVALQRYKAGLTGYLTVLSTESALLEERRADTALRARALALDVALKQALGGGVETAALPSATLPGLARKDP
jgi:NodT family efflux transporter outer membrane factor (OMF) lipoprotein